MRCMDADESCDRHHASQVIPAEANSIYAGSTVRTVQIEIDHWLIKETSGLDGEKS